MNMKHSLYLLIPFLLLSATSTSASDEETAGKIIGAAMVEWNNRVDIYHELEMGPGMNEVELRPTGPEDYGALEVLVTDTESHPLAGIQLFLLDPVDSPLGKAKQIHPFTISGKDGKLRYDGLPPGKYGLHVTHPDGMGYLLDARIEVKEKSVSQAKIVVPKV